MRIRILLGLAAGSIVALAQHGAVASPQILAVLATPGGVPMTCTGGVCAAELSAFCLQRDRPAPPYGTAYGPAAPGVFTLVVTDANGDERRLPASPHVAFTGERSYTTVSALVSERVLAGLGAVSAKLEVGDNASLVPLPRPGDPDPLTSDEIEHTVGPLRAMGTQIVDTRPEAQAARVVASMINVLPEYDRVGAARRAAVWSEAVGRFGDESGLSHARAAYDGCIEAAAAPSAFSLRSCLETRHDQLLRDLNDNYWNAFSGS